MAETKFGKRIRSIRQNAECSQKEFCTVLDIPQSTLSAYETDRMQPTVATLINIATKFNVSLDWLCGIDKTNGGKYIDSKSIGLRIRTLRLERNLTQTDFAKMISKSLRTVQKYENGEIEINISTANDIARILDVSASYILGNDDTVLSSQLPKFPQTFYEKLIYLIEDKGITKNKLLTDLKLNRNSFGNWQKQGSKPRAETMERIAEYFEVTPESLTKDNTEIQYLPTAKKLIAQPAPPTVKLNGTNFTAEIPAYVFTELMSVLLENIILFDGLRKGWQTGTSLRTTRLAYNLWCTYIDENPKYSTPDEIFCCSYAPYYFEAIMLRYPEYLEMKEV